MIFGPLAAVIFLADDTNVAQLFLMYTYLTLLGSRIWNFALVWRNVEVYLAEAAEALEAIWADVDVADIPDSQPLEVTKGEIVFKNVDFSYLQGDPLFTTFTATIEPKQKIGLVGPSGGGKTTLLKLLLRFMDTQNGAIEIDGQNIATVDQTSLRNTIAYIPQEPVLFHRTIAENILYGQPTLTEKAMHQAAKQAYAHDFIVDLPNGYDTLVGERGIKLSGGQRQRIAIARAFLKPAKILVLDEATSALDSESEQLIQDALAHLIEDKTVVSIAHRLSTLQIMDRLLVLREGEIIEDGSHTDLLAANGLYTQLWQHQSGGYLK